MKAPNFLLRTTIALAALSAAVSLSAQEVTGGEPKPPVLTAAVRVAHATTAELLAAARAGKRVVAVGDHGIVLLSDDDGATWRQAKAVPVDSLLTSVSFADDRNGWAVGHWGVVIHTADGGETWTVQRSAAQEDRPLFAVHFADANRGVAVGLWSLVLATQDGGKSWHVQKLDPPDGSKKADLNLYSLFEDDKGSLYAAGERGMVLQSRDLGQTWTYIATGYKGSFWTGTALPGGILIVGGLRGSLYRSADSGGTWVRIETGSHGSITDLEKATEAGKATVVAVNLDGAILRSKDDGATFTSAQGASHAPLTALIARSSEGEILFSRNGPVSR